MALVDTLLSRRSIRQFEQKAIPQTELETILEAGQKAPSAMNMTTLQAERPLHPRPLRQGIGQHIDEYAHHQTNQGEK